MEKTLHTIQVLSKIGRILSKIIMIACIVAASICLVGIILLGIGVNDILKIGGTTIFGVIEGNSQMEVSQMYFYLINGLVFTAAEAVIAGFASHYFKNELADGTPFTFNGAKQMLRLGIVSIVAFLVAQIIVGGVESIIIEYTKLKLNTDISIGDSVSTGVIFIVVSQILKYGAELSEKHRVGSGEISD